ncbi:PHP domain-containing protein [Texas Phoenix palm phytoplasma]|uniref:DNA-directed DNA polymerase n=1 Tax=Texas Phoenix palm phytoplasma TaxID=176709 RepID=A0ABS5BIT3_9MOLU|nr:PHP domain-containing protein [Texas Phoenix palm phytoplasma]MBP3059459.1 PHP domain-containing protein [Texas Phoenix palm phytoplasma]
MTGVFYLQSYYSILNSMNSLESLVKKAKDNLYDFVALSDNENLYGMINFLELCNKYKIKPILGIKIKINLSEILSQDKNIGILIYAMNDIGLNNLIQISNIIRTSNNKIIDLKTLKSFQEGLFFVLSNIDFVLSNILDFKFINKIFYKLQKELNNFFFGLSLQSRWLKFLSNNYFLPLIKELNIQIVPTHKTNFLEKDEELCYELLIHLSNDYDNLSKNNFLEDEELKQISNPTNLENWCYQFLNKKQIEEYYNEYFSNQEYCYLFLDLKKFLNSVKYLKIFPSKFFLPKFRNYNKKKAIQKLKEISYDFLLEKRKNNNFDFELYKDRIDKELKIIEEIEYQDYFLIVYDLVSYSKKNSVLIGPGRGSSSSSLVCFCLGITEIDPLEHNLLFERFLNNQRKKMPDIDLDFPDNKIKFILNYILKKYGENFIANIVTFNTFTIKSFVRNLNYFKGKINLNFLKKIKNNINKISNRFVGIPHFTGTHPAGIVISDKNLFEYCPIQKNPIINSSFLYQTQFDVKQLSKIGLLKIDLLTLKSLNLIDKILNKINNNKQNVFWNQISLFDEETYKILKNSDTDYIFQLESFSAKKVLQKIKPQNFKELIAVLALNRPGPINYLNEYCFNKELKKQKFIHSSIDFILEETYGIILYQEQIMQIAIFFAGYSLGESEIFMKKISDYDNLNLVKKSLKKEFIRKSMLNNHSYELSYKIYDFICKFSNYTFNKSHSSSYSLISYRMAYLKSNYFNIFIIVILNDYIKDIQETKKILIQLKYKRKFILLPNILESEHEYKFYEGKILLPLTLIKNLSEEICSLIVQERKKKKFQNFYDFKFRCKKFLDNELLRNLIFSGSLDVFGLNKKTLIEDSDLSFLEHEENLSIYKKNIIYEEYDLKYLKQESFKVFGLDLFNIID